VTASSTHGSLPPSAERRVKSFGETFAVNVKAPFLLTAAIAPRMMERGAGTIINVTTMVAEFGMAGLSGYGASKAVALLTKTWAAEYGPNGVRVNAVSPRPDDHPRHRRHGRRACGDHLGRTDQWW
jgi:NAD(P)-dependent dehydrogenase (short-subunit alcohol dehydrogenase family)